MRCDECLLIFVGAHGLRALKKQYCEASILYFGIIYQKYFDIRYYLITFAKNWSKMRIVSHKKLRLFYQTPGNEDAKVALERWYEIVEGAEWNSFSDIKEDFGSVDYVGNQHYVFNIKGNKYRLVVVIKLVMGYVFIRFVGTHKEYDSIDASTI